jgi:putative tryptophan/tyrosine transport system substrate-binding protein
MQFGQLKRRDLITLLGGAAAWPLTARAQQHEQMRRIGVLMGYAESDQEAPTFVAAFREELSKKLGWVEGRNIRTETRWAAPNDTESRLRFAKEIVALRPDLVLSHGTLSTAALLQQTRSLPVIFVNVSDPIGSGFVTSFAKPGGSVTGFNFAEPTMARKWLQLLKEIAPRVTRGTVLFNPTTAPYIEYFLNPLKATAASLAVEPIIARVHDAAELETAIAAQTGEQTGGLIVMPDTFTYAHREKIVALAAQYHLPAVYSSNRFFAAIGDCCRTGATPSIIFGVRRPAPIASFGARSPASCPSRPQSSSSWSSTSRPRRHSA